jgi:phosphocarrier protein HPr
VIDQELIIRNRLGLHARAAARFVHLASRFRSKVQLSKDGVSVDGKSILGLLTLSGSQGSSLRLTVEGEDEADAVREIVALVNGRFGEEA